MTATAAPFGLRPINHASGQVRVEVGTIASAYGTAIYKNGPVTMLSDGTIGAAGVGDSLIGSFQGCRYIDAQGKPTYSNYWPASTVATEIVAEFTRDPEIRYEIQCAGTIAQTVVGNKADFASVAGVAATGQSAASISATTATTTAQLQILEFRPGPDNAAGDAFPIVIVRIAEHQLVFPTTAGI
jgi:hypothetical protein